MIRNPNWIVEISYHLADKKEILEIVHLETASGIMPCWTEDDFNEFRQGKYAFIKPVFLRSRDVGTLIIGPDKKRRLMAGYLCYSIEKEFLRIQKRGDLLVLSKLVVNPFCWRQGVGTEMLAYVITRLRLNMRRMIIPISVYNSEGAEFLKRCDFGCKNLGDSDYNPRGIRCLWEEPDFFGQGHNGYIFGFEKRFESQETTVIDTDDIGVEDFDPGEKGE